MIRLLYFMPVYKPAWVFGGPILSVSRLCEGMVESGNSVRVITTRSGLEDRENWDHPTLVDGVEVYYYKDESLLGAIWSNELISDLERQVRWADIIHLSSIWQPLGTRVQKEALKQKKPVIQTARGALGLYSWKMGWWKKIPYFLLVERRFLQKATAIQCTSVKECGEIQSFGLKPKIIVIPNPFGDKSFSTLEHERVKWRERYDVGDCEFVFLVVGRLHHKKGLEILPDALASIERTDWKIFFVGNEQDDSMNMLKSRFREYRLEDRVVWINSIPSGELVGPYNGADALLLPSRHENFGNVVVEALACGCGVVMSDQVGAAGVLEGCPGVHVVERDSKLWAERLHEVMNAKRPGKSSEDWIVKRLDTKIVVQKMIKEYRRIIDNA